MKRKDSSETSYNILTFYIFNKNSSFGPASSFQKISSSLFHLNNCREKEKDEEKSGSSFGGCNEKVATSLGLTPYSTLV